MKNTKRFMALLLALVLVFSSMTTAFADVNEDVVDTTYETAVTKLSAVGIMEGYPDGTFRPEGQITRAEFAKIAVLALGLNDAAEVSKSNTIFTDVDAFHWAAGYINVAVDRGILKGYPDGSYKPSNPLSNAEAITILTRLIGLAPVVDKDGNWPANYITQANILGIMDDVAVASTSNATRGNAAKMLVNTLTVQKWGATGYNNDGTVQYGQLEFSNEIPKTLLNDNLNVSDLTDDYAAFVEDYDLDHDEITVTWRTESSWARDTFKLLEATGADFYELFLNEVDMWVNSDDEVIFAEIVSEFYMDAVEIKDGGKEFKLAGLDKTFKVDSDIVSDSEALYDDNVIAGLNNKYELAKVVLNDHGRVVAYDMYTDFDMTVVDTTEDDVVTALDGEEFDFDGYAVFKDGKFASVEDMEKGDVLFFAKDQDKKEGKEAKVVEIYNKSLSGEITAVFKEAFDVDDKEYKYDDTTLGQAQYLNEDDNFAYLNREAAEKFEDADEDVSLFFDRFGKVVYVTGDLGKANTNTVAGIMLSDVRFDLSFKRAAGEFEFVNEEGTKVVETLTFESLKKINGKEVDSAAFATALSSTTNEVDITFSKDADGNEYSPKVTETLGFSATADNDASAGRIVEFVYDEDGSIVELNFLDEITNASGTAGDIDITEDNYVGNNKLSSSTVIFMIDEKYLDPAKNAPYGKGDIKVITLGDAEFEDITQGTSYVSNNKVKYIVTEDTNAKVEDTKVTAFIDSVRRNSDGDVTRMTAWVDGGKTTYTVDKVGFTFTNGVKTTAAAVTLTVRDDDSVVTNIVPVNDIELIRVTSVDISDSEINNFKLTDDVVILDATGSDLKEVKLRDIKDGYDVYVSKETSTYVDLVVIEDKN